MSLLFSRCAAALLALVLPTLCAGASNNSFGSKPHLIMFVVDDLGWHNVEWHNPEMKTPNSLALLREGIQLDRSYVFQYCAPTRSSILSGRLPYHVNQVILPLKTPDWDMPPEMTALPKKLKQAGYATHMVGKWHVGTQSFGQLPVGRGFDTSLHYQEGAEDHWTQASCSCSACNCPSGFQYPPLPDMKSAGFAPQNTMDMWCSDRPCWGRNGTTYHMGRNGQVVGDIAHYGDNVYTEEALRIISKHDPQVPLFFYIAFQCNHEPLEAPDDFIDMYPSSWREDRRWYAAMTTYWDYSVGRVVKLLKSKGMWDNTLVVLTTDNGGPTYWTTDEVANNYPPLVPGARKGYAHGGGANNWPLKGSKVSNWEGGTRGASLASGGFLPAKVRGTVLDEYMHVTDWYSTFCHLAGVDPTDSNRIGTRSNGKKFSLPPIDSINMWDLISGEEKKSPRTEIPVCIDMPLQNGSTALIVGDYKLLLGPQTFSFWQGPAFPNGTEPYGRFPPYNVEHCGHGEIKWGPVVVQKMEGGCLFNIREDPSETKNLAQEKPDVLEALKKRYLELKATALDQRTVLLGALKGTMRYHSNWVQMLKKNKGFVGPWCTDGACEPAASDEDAQTQTSDMLEVPYMLGGPFPGFRPYGGWTSPDGIESVYV